MIVLGDVRFLGFSYYAAPAPGGLVVLGHRLVAPASMLGLGKFTRAAPVQQLWIDGVMVCEGPANVGERITEVDCETPAAWGYVEINPAWTIVPYDDPLSYSSSVAVNGVSPRSGHTMQVNDGQTDVGTGFKFLVDSLADVTVWFYLGNSPDGDGRSTYISIYPSGSSGRVGGAGISPSDSSMAFAYLYDAPEATNFPSISDGWHSVRYIYVGA